MRTLILLATIAIVAAVGATTASAGSCKDAAQDCLNLAINSGGDKAYWQKLCFAPERMASCRKTLSFDGPGGVRRPADRP